MTLETLTTILTAALAVLPALYGRLLQSLLRHTLRQLQAGQAAWRFDPDADKTWLAFPGQRSWMAALRDHDEIARWLRRSHQVGLQRETHEILIDGPPWNTSACVRFSDRCMAPNGEIVYGSRGALFFKIAWGKITCCEVHEDTQKVAALNDYLKRHQPACA